MLIFLIKKRFILNYMYANVHVHMDVSAHGGQK